MEPKTLATVMKEAVDGPLVAIIVPCYNERGAIEETMEALSTVMEGTYPYEIVVVDDGSTDGMSEILDRIAQRFSNLRVMRHATNRGYGASLKTGIHSTSAPLIVITDADGTYPNERIPELIGTMISGGFDMVVGARTAADARYSWLRSIPKYFLTRYASWVARQPIPDINSGMRVFRRDVAVKYFPIFPDGFSFTTTITLAMLTNNYLVNFTPIGYSPRVGKSKIRPIRDTINFVILIGRTGVYFAPLRIFMPLGLGLGAAGLISFAFDVARWNLTQTTLLLLLFSLQTMIFALIADMIDKRTML